MENKIIVEKEETFCGYLRVTTIIIVFALTVNERTIVFLFTCTGSFTLMICDVCKTLACVVTWPYINAIHPYLAKTVLKLSSTT